MVLCVTQGPLASFLLSPSYRWPQTTRFRSLKGPQHFTSGLISFRINWCDLLAIQGTYSQESSPAPQFKRINYSALTLLYGPTLTSVHDYWKLDLCQQSNVSDFSYAVEVRHRFSFKGQVFFNLLAAVPYCSDFGAQEKQTCHCFSFFQIYLP